MADGIVASVNDRIITGYDLRQRMLMLILSSEIQPTQENLPAIQQAALNALIEERLKAQEITNYESLRVSDEEVSAEIAEMARRAGLTPDAYLAQLSQAGIQPQAFRENLRTEIGWSQLVGGRFNSRARASRYQVEAEVRRLNEAASKPQYLVGEIYIEAARVGGQQAALDGAVARVAARRVRGAARLDELFARTAELGMPALAMTDHGNVFGAYEFYKACTAAGVKPIIGMEAYLTPNTSRFDKTRVRWADGGDDDVSGAGAGAGPSRESRDRPSTTQGGGKVGHC